MITFQECFPTDCVVPRVELQNDAAVFVVVEVGGPVFVGSDVEIRVWAVPRSSTDSVWK
jgi:hypothetical protein